MMDSYLTPEILGLLITEKKNMQLKNCIHSGELRKVKDYLMQSSKLL